MDKSGIALFILSVGCGIIVAAILTSTVKGVGCKRYCVVCKDTGSTIVTDLKVIKTQSVGFLGSVFKQDLEPILVALSSAYF